MGEAYIVRRGGGTKLFAAIGVTYPEGSTCTCTGEGKTLTAKTTTGQWVFPVPKAGTYTVTATDGTNTKSQSVSITTEGQLESVELSYWDGELFVDGNAYSDITGGFEVANWIGLNWFEADIEDESSGSYLQASYTGKSAGGLFTANKIDVTSYNTLTCVFDPESTFVNNSSAFQAYVAVSDSVGGTIKDPFASVFVTYAQTNSKISVDLDISDLTGSYHLGFASFNARQESMIRVTELRLLR